MKQGTAQGPIRFGVFEFDPATGELRKNGLKVKLQGQSLQVLQVLLERPGQVLTRQELRQGIWPADTFVDFDHGLYNAIQKLREALGDSADTPRYVETLARRGYRFIGAVNGNSAVQSTPAIEIPQATPGPATTRKWKPSLAMLLGAAVLVPVLALILGLRTIRRGEVRPASAAVVKVNSLAVLPFQNLSGDPAQDYLADGMTDVLTNDLSQISELKVISRTSAMRYKNTEKSLPQIARELNVNAVVEGMVLPSGNRVRITAELIQGATDQHIWASSYERNIQDVLALQGEIAQAIAAEVRVKLTPQEQVRLSRASPLNLKAVNAYLKGRYHYQKARGMAARRGVSKPREEEKQLALEYFQKAIAEKPNSSEASEANHCKNKS
jgi:TolB-like protein/DNA-binding winged helix-turn-helix (wHTH) protein